MTIYDIKAKVTNAPHFFDKDTLKFFGQTMKSFKVTKVDTNVYKVSAPAKGITGRMTEKTVRYFNAKDNKFYSNLDDIS